MIIVIGLHLDMTTQTSISTLDLNLYFTALRLCSLAAATQPLAEFLLVKVFKRLYLLNFWMEVVQTCPDVRYLSEVLCCATLTHTSDLEVKVLDLEKKKKKKKHVKVFT